MVKSTKKQNILPQTGESKSELGIIGLGLALVGTLVGLVYRKRKE
ncbi:LPXTG cell wall anchor domain-containing protein [Lactobacillus acidophilus]|nr:LPXTG cell wall anchor domain-containing protein [Lactobacillus acidophilus]